MTINLLKFIIILAAALLFIIPIFVLFIFKKGSFKSPHNKKNFKFILIAILEIVLFALLINFINGIGNIILNIPIIGELLNSVFSNMGDKTDYIMFVIVALIVNLLALYIYMFIKLGIYSGLLASLKAKKKKKSDETDEEVKDENKEKDEDKNNKKRLGEFLKESKDELEKQVYIDKFGDEVDVEPVYSNFKKKIFGLFFEEPDYVHVKPWVFKTRIITQDFIKIFVSIYTLFLFVLVLTLVFKMNDGVYNILINYLKVDKWFIYPFLPLILLQEICNFFNVEMLPYEGAEDEEIKIIEKKEVDPSVEELNKEIIKRFDEEHHLRFYPSIDYKKVDDYVPTNRAFASAIEFIRNQMNFTSGHVVQSYLECLDAMYNDNHVYFCASFYSEFGEYLINYVYTRLLAGERIIFIIPDKKNVEDFKKYILLRLTKLTKSSEEYSWRVYSTDEHIEQADILVGYLEEFNNDSMVENNPIFFEEVCNAIFIDSDKIVMLESYLCPIISMKLLKATNNRIKYIFISNNIYRGFAAGSLPKFFCVEKVLNFSCAKENESVTYTIWNRESKSNRIYSKYGQTLTSPECIIAELAYQHGIDGIKVITESPIEHSDKEVLTKHEVEINNFYKEIPDVNYLVYTDELNNLSSAVYLCARFRGKKDSIIHILTKPYLLREYFLSKMINEDFVNRSSFIQPRVVEHADDQKLSLLRVFCEASNEEGMEVTDFVRTMHNVISLSIKRSDKPLCSFCAKLLQEYKENIQNINLKELTQYLIAGLCDSINTPLNETNAIFSKDYYIIVDITKSDGINTIKTKNIIFKRTKTVFDKILSSIDKVSLVLNDKKIGYLNTFSTRVKSEYIIGQNIVFNNVEYEIEQISQDCRTIFLKRENVKYKNIFDTIHLRRFKELKYEEIGLPGELYFSKGEIEYIRVKQLKIDVLAETYGFYNLMSDNQSLDLVNGVQGNPQLDKRIVDDMARNIVDGKALELEIDARMEVNDGMRLLISSIINEFIKTLFPFVYRCVAVCPVLEQPFDFEDDYIPSTYEESVKCLYPLLTKEAKDDDSSKKAYKLKEESNKKLRFIFINDAINEDVGVLNWFFDLYGHLMQELLINVYSYLAWLNARIDSNGESSVSSKQKHYIFFGNDSLPECFDLQGSCKLLGMLNVTLSDKGDNDFETASDENDDIIEYCSFCHNIVESGRYTTFNKNRIICHECYDVVTSEEKLQELADEVYEYLENNYPEENFRRLEVKLDEIYNLEKGEELNEYYYCFDNINHLVKVEKSIPITNAKACILRAIISSWQEDNNLMISYTDGQLYFEEILYLKRIDKERIAQWTLDSISEIISQDVNEILDYVSYTGEDENEFLNQKLTSFSFMRMKAREFDEYENRKKTEALDEIDDNVGLYDPNSIPRLWKKFLILQSKDLEDESNDDDPIAIEDSLVVDEPVEDENPENNDPQDNDSETEE